MVWSPQLGARAEHVPGGMQLMTDPRARHYWDPDRVVGTGYQPFLGLEDPAWDVWLLFGEDAGWDGEVPEPDWWEHQLRGLPEERRLDADRFASRAAELLRTASAPREEAADEEPGSGKE